ncbi:MAG: alpha-glucan family phosphorylase, partial [Planctomycetota bacterium]
KRIAYFCSEYAIHESLQQYSGGLGVLAGDHLKSASDLGVPLCAVGLLYQHGYYIQEFEPDGSTRVLYPRYDFAELPIEDTGVDVTVPVGRRKVKCRIWKQQVGRVPIYLLDADRKGNKPEDRELTEGLYKGEPELRLRQQVLLGVGGVRALEAVGESIDVYHLNEGHAAFANVERLRALVEGGASYESALAKVRKSSVFTTHTPVAAGHDRYGAKLVFEHMGPIVKPLGLKAESLADLGRETPGNAKEPLCMTVLALNTSARANGVSALHGEVSREMWVGAFPEAETADDVPIGHVTNGIHTRTWLSPDAYALYDEHLSPAWDGAGPEDDFWAAVDKIPDGDVWELRNRLRRRLVHFVRTRMARQAVRHGQSADEVARCRELFDDDALTICFARRFATYKRAPLIFRDPERLAGILSNAKRPVQLVFAGKAHPRDKGGQAYAQSIHEFSREARFAGRVALIEEYDMQVGRALTSGADVWLNNPIRPHEASGTSGMKPPLHGGINCSILDGWWPESHDGTNGWAIGDGRERATQDEQDAADAEALYRLLEKQVVPEFYKRGKNGLPTAWVARAKASMRTVPAQFSTHRMVADYVREAYWPSMAR